MTSMKSRKPFLKKANAWPISSLTQTTKTTINNTHMLTRRSKYPNQRCHRHHVLIPARPHPHCPRERSPPLHQPSSHCLCDLLWRQEATQVTVTVEEGGGGYWDGQTTTDKEHLRVIHHSRVIQHSSDQGLLQKTTKCRLQCRRGQTRHAAHSHLLPTAHVRTTLHPQGRRLLDVRRRLCGIWRVCHLIPVRPCSMGRAVFREYPRARQSC